MSIEKPFSNAAKLVQLQDEAKDYTQSVLEEMKKRINGFNYIYTANVNNCKHCFTLPFNTKIYINNGYTNIGGLPGMYLFAISKGRTARKSPCIIKAGHVVSTSNNTYRFPLEDHKEAFDLVLGHYIADHYPQAISAQKNVKALTR